MKPIHPKLDCLGACVAIALSIAAGGCRNQSGGSISSVNPFLAPDRVPPPATRSLLPGQAQPYYPGDPLPVMQSGAAAPAGSTLAAGQSQEMPSADDNLTWGSPSKAPSTTVTVPRQPQLVASAESSVAIPADGDSLRFALPEPVEPEPFTPFAPFAPSPLAASQQPARIASAPTPQVVLPASYNAPVDGNTQPAVMSPWRTPQVADAGTWSTNGVQRIVVPPPPTAQPIAQAALATPPMVSVPLVTTTNSMDVRLRAVHSPPLDAVPTMPRIRLPGYASAPTLIGSNDGFRPRSSMR